MTDQIKILWTDSVRGLLLLFLAILANFLGVTMNCQLQKKMVENSLFRNIAILCLIYFTINFTSYAGLHPGWLLLGAFPIYVLFILLMKQTLPFLLVELLVILGIFIATQTRTFYENVATPDTKKIRTIDVVILYFLTPFLVLVLLAGFVVYLQKQRREHPKDFSALRFVFGTNRCASSK